MALLPADGFVAQFMTQDGGRYTEPLICWREDDTCVYGMVLHKGSLRRAEALNGFLNYRTAEEQSERRLHAVG